MSAWIVVHKFQTITLLAFWVGFHYRPVQLQLPLFGRNTSWQLCNLTWPYSAQLPSSGRYSHLPYLIGLNYLRPKP